MLVQPTTPAGAASATAAPVQRLDVVVDAREEDDEVVGRRLVPYQRPLHGLAARHCRFGIRAVTHAARVRLRGRENAFPHLFPSEPEVPYLS